MRQQRLQQLYPVSSEPVMIAVVGWQCSCGRIHPTRECTDAVVQLRAISDSGLGYDQLMRPRYVCVACMKSGRTGLGLQSQG
jgi:hypothetical protein